MKKTKLMRGIPVILTVLCMILGSCDNKPEAEPGFQYPKRYQVVPAWTEKGENTIEISAGAISGSRAVTGSKYLPVLYAGSDYNEEEKKDANDYVIYLGHINNVPIVSGISVYYDGRTSVDITRATNESIATTIGKSVSKTVSESTTKTTVSSKEVSASAKAAFGPFSAEVHAKATKTVTNTKKEETSITDALSTAESKTSGVTDTVGAWIGNNGEPKGRYRWTLFATTDIYLSVQLSEDNSEVLGEPEISVCAREASYTWQIDYDPNNSDVFGKNSGGEMLPLPDGGDFSSLSLLPKFVAVGASGRVAHSIDGVRWESIPAVSFNDWNSVVFGKGGFVAVGASGSIAYSTDGETWTPPTAGTYNWNGVTYGNNRFVTVGASGRMAYSTDGETWTSLTAGTYNWNGVVYGNGRYVAAGASGRMAYSTNGSLWTVITVGSVNWNGVTYGNNMFVAVGASGSIAYSTDGTSWSQTTAGTDTWNNVNHANGGFVAVGASGKMAYSTNGYSWTVIGLDSTNTNWLDVTYGNGLWVAIGGAPGNTGRIAISYNGINWAENTVSDTVGASYWRSVTFGKLFKE